MNYLLDTNLISEVVKARPDPGVIAWLSQTDEDRTFISVVTLTELSYGIEKLPQGARRSRLSQWLRDELAVRFEGRMLSVDPRIAAECGKVMARSEAAGRPIKLMDAFIAATARVHELALVTRNQVDFEHSVRMIVNPWSA